MNKLILPVDTGQVSDGYYSFDELYEKAGLLMCLTVHEDPQAWKSRKDSNGNGLPGWFIVGTSLGEYKMACYLPESLWEYCHADEVDEAELDGHGIGEFCFAIKMYLEEGKVYLPAPIADPVARK